MPAPAVRLVAPRRACLAPRCGRPRSVSSLRVTAEVQPAAGANGRTSAVKATARLRHCVAAEQFDTMMLEEVFSVADEMKLVQPGTPGSQALQGCVMSTLFYEPSTRTRLSFESAMLKLGGAVAGTENAGQYSSAAKGETLEDTIRTVEGYSDVIVLRHFLEGSARIAMNAASVPIINAGDGPGQHPTQALLDTYTIRDEIGRLDNIKLGVVGDLANGRTVHSLCIVMSMYKNVKMYFIAPDVVRMKQSVKDYLTAAGVEWEEVDNLRDVASICDVLYQTRIQKERFLDNPEDYLLAKGKFIIDASIMEVMKPDAIVMHPLPRVDEIATEVDSDPRAAYFRQAKNGLFIRMALLKILLQDRLLQAR
mmetsp:Transcript_96/g.243  ORF Transcript_96/g.243 Transcript_96/m.243 type:complete len:366 (-) Transcript_96:225-1322(-)